MNTPIFVSSRPTDPFYAKLDKPIGEGKLQRSSVSTGQDLAEHKKLAESDGKANIILRNQSANELHTISVDSAQTLSQLKLGQAAKIGSAVGYVVFIDHDGNDDKK
jgi:hypothetical protein